MQIKKNIQNLGFSIKDISSGRKTTKAIQQIRGVQYDPFNENSEIYRDLLLNKLVAYAKDQVPFYHKMGIEDFAKLPILKKSEIASHFDDFRSQEFLNQELFQVHTSGSTGVPFKLYQNKEKRARNTADVLYFMSKTGYEIGNKLFELEVWRSHNLRSSLKNYLQSTIQFDISHLNDQRITELVHRIKKTKGPKNILGFSSGLEAICQYLETQDLCLNDQNFQGIIANSEYLNDYTRNALGYRLGCPVYSRYSNEELGILAHQTYDSEGKFELNWSSFYFEILDMEQDVPAEEGQLGRLVISDLFNYAMPILRYDTGDVGQFEIGADGRKYLKSVEGRKMDVVYDTRGNHIASYLVYTLFYPYYNELHQYQFIQTGADSYLIKINPKDKFERELDLIAGVQREFGMDANVRVEYVDEIPALNSGKRRKVVNAYHQ